MEQWLDIRQRVLREGVTVSDGRIGDSAGG